MTVFEPGRDVTGDATPATPATPSAEGFLSASPGRRGVESVFVRLVATAGVIGLATALGALLAANEIAGWIVSLTVSIVSVLFAAVLWRSRKL